MKTAQDFKSYPKRRNGFLERGLEPRSHVLGRQIVATLGVEAFEVTFAEAEVERFGVATIDVHFSVEHIAAHPVFVGNGVFLDRVDAIAHRLAGQVAPRRNGLLKACSSITSTVNSTVSFTFRPDEGLDVMEQIFTQPGVAGQTGVYSEEESSCWGNNDGKMPLRC